MMANNALCFSLSIVGFVSPANWYLTIVVDDQERTIHLKRRKLDLSEARAQPTWCFRTTSRKFGLCLSRHGTSRVSTAPLQLDDLPRWKDAKRVLTFQKLETVITIELCALNFGIAILSPSLGLVVAREQNPLLVSLVCDVKVLEVRGIEWKKHDVAQVVVQHAQSPPCYLLVENTKGKAAFSNGDCTFFCDASDMFLKIALQDRKGETFKSARVALDFGGVKTFWVELVPKIAGEGDSAWLLLQAQVTEEGQPSFLSGYGEPLHAIPFRVSFGDVVLFDDSGLMAHVVSGVTGGKYDHIGIVVPVPPHDKRSLMEASRKGCFAYPIENRMKETLENKARVGLRRLKREGGASEKIRETLRNFVDAHEGKGYESVMTVVKSRFRANSHDNADELFCSELVALALMSLGVITGDRLAANYLPSDFAQGTVPGAQPDSFEAIKFHGNTGNFQPRSRRPSKDIDASGITSPREVRKAGMLLSPLQSRKASSPRSSGSAGQGPGQVQAQGGGGGGGPSPKPSHRRVFSHGGGDMSKKDVLQ